jgi:hypothetical protein
MKVLRYISLWLLNTKRKLATWQMTAAANKSLGLYSSILDWDMLKEVDNPLGFNPFTTLFPSYEKTDQLLWNTVQVQRRREDAKA